MAYQILRNVHQPCVLRQADELVYFTQSVIKMEQEIFQSDNERKTKTFEVRNTRTFPESTSFTPELRQIGLDDRNISTPIESRRSVQAGKGAKSVGLDENSRQIRLVSSSREPVFESEAVAQEMPQHISRPQRQMTESRDSIIWSPPLTCNRYDEPSGCNITLSRVYFAQGSEINGNKIHADEYNCARSAPEEFESLNLPPNNNITDRQKNGFMDKTLVPSRRQSASSSLNSSLARPSPLFGGMFQNPQPARGYNKRAEKRSSSETEEYVYFLPESTRPKSLSRDAICFKSYADSNKYFPPAKCSKNHQERPNRIDLTDEKEASQCANKEANLVQVTTDSEGRIRVKVVTSPTKDRQNVEATKTQEGQSTLETNNGCLERNPRESSNSKDYLEINECSSKAINPENQIPETCIHTSALITNDHRWYAWRRANCVPSDEFDSENGFNHYKEHRHCRTGQFCDEGDLERYVIVSQDENNNNCSGVETPHPKNIIQTSNIGVPDNSMSSHAEPAKQNSNLTKCCDQMIQRERCTRLFDIPKDNCSGNYQSMVENDQRRACIDRKNAHYQKTQIHAHNNLIRGPRGEVSDKQLLHKQSYENTTENWSFGALEGDAGANCSKYETISRQEATAMKDTREVLASTIVPRNKGKDVQTLCSTPRNKGTNRSQEVMTEKRNRGRSSKKETKLTENDSNLSKETETKSISTESASRYQCDWPACDKSFRHYSFLVLHKRIHTGERPYVCSWQGCDKQFRRSDDYQRHYRVHTGVKPYTCVFCGKGFKRSDHRLFHYRAIHHVDNRGKSKNRYV